MTFLALFIFKRGVCGLARLVMVIFIHGEMDDDVFDAVECFCIEKIKGVMGAGRWQYAQNSGVDVRTMV